MMDRCHLLKEDGSVEIRMSKLKMLIENIILFCLYSFQ